MAWKVPWRVVIVTGGRGFSDRQVLFDAMDKLAPQLVIEGGASGADLLARKWAEERGVAHLTDWALWAKNGKAAGPWRNEHMLVIAQRIAAYGDGYLCVAAFPGGKGTENMVSVAVRAGVPVHRFGVEAGVSPDLVP